VSKLRMQSTPDSFYAEPTIVERYELGRSRRVFVRNLPLLLNLPATSSRDFAIPLSAIFDWIYNSRLDRLVVPHLTGTILDVACGTSYVFRSLFASGWAGRVYGVDRSRPMLDEGTARLKSMLDWSPPDPSTFRGLFRYSDALGRTTIDVAPPRPANYDAVNHLLSGRVLGDVRQLPCRAPETICAFSGPLCFFDLADQGRITKSIADEAGAAVALQYKNHAFYEMNQNPRAICAIAGIIDHILKSGIEDSYSFLVSINASRTIPRCEVAPGAHAAHEVAGFDYFLTPLAAIEAWLDTAGFALVSIGTMGFMSETFFRLAQQYYHCFSRNPTAFARYVRALIGIDEYFCLIAGLGDNLQVCAVRKRTTQCEPITYSFDRTFRHNYSPDGGLNISAANVQERG